MQDEPVGFPSARKEKSSQKSARGNAPAALLLVSAGGDRGKGPAPEMGPALGQQGRGRRKARAARISGSKPAGRSSVPQLHAQARADTNRNPATLGMAARREPLRSETRRAAQPASGPSGIEPYSSLTHELTGSRCWEAHQDQRRTRGAD